MLRDAWRLALGTLTAVPVAPPVTVDRRRAGVAMVLAPVAMVPLGVALAVVVAAGHWWDLDPHVAALLALAVTIAGNRGLHVDGLSDMADGLAASFERERSLDVMKSGTSGPAGVVTTVLVIALQAAGLAALLSAAEWWRAAVLGGVALCVSRVALVVCCTRGVRPAREDGLGRTYAQTVAAPWAAVAVAAAIAGLAVAGWWAGLSWWHGMVAGVLAVGVCVLVVVHAVRRFGGVTGDVFGASIELAFATILVSLS